MMIRTTLSLAALAGLATAQIVREPLVEDMVRDIPRLFEWILPQAQEYTLDKWTAERGKVITLLDIYICLLNT